MVEKKMIASRVNKLFNILILLAVSWILIIALVASVQKFSWLFLVALCLFFIIIHLIWKRLCVFSVDDKRLQIIFFVLTGIAFLLCLVVGYSLEVDVYDTWDYGQLIRTVYEDIVNGEFVNAEYYARYPNNSMFLLILSLYFKLLYSAQLVANDIYSYVNATIPVNCALIILSVVFTFFAAKTFFSTKTAFKCGVIMLGMTPLYLYAAIAYTDVFAIFPLTLSVFFYSKMKSCSQRIKKILWITLTAVTLAVGYKIKATLIILFVAVVIDYILMILRKKEKIIDMILFLALFIVTVSGCSTVSDHYLNQNGTSEMMREQQEFPVTHWIMMGLNPEFDGGYNQDDVDLTMSFIGKKEKTEANIIQIHERIKKMGIWGTLDHVFIKKVARMWGSGDCSASDYVSRQPLRDNLLRDIFSLSGTFNVYYRFAAQVYYMFVIFSVFFVALQNVYVRNDNAKKSFMIELSILGVFLFFLIWECNARYLFVFLPLFALVAADDKKIWFSKKLTV